MPFNPSRREEICRLAGQISCQSLQLRDIVGNIYQRGQSPARPPSAAPSSPPGFEVRQSVSGGKCGGGRKASAARHKGSTSQFLTVQVPVSMASQFMATQNVDAGELSARQSVSSLGSDEGPKIPTTSHISRRPKPRPPPKPKAEEPEPAHPRPYEDDPIWGVWESNMLRLTQLLKMLLQELRSVSDYTKIDEPTLMAAASAVGSGVPLAEASAADAFATKVAASSIIGGMYNRENVSNALHNPAPFQQLYAPPPQVNELSSTDHLSSEPVREHIDLSVYFSKLASQMEALTQALKPNPFPPHAGAPMADRLIPLEENVGRLAHNLADVSRAIARPVDPLDVLMSSRAKSPAGQPMQVRAEAQVDNGEGVSMANRANVNFQLDGSASSQPSSSAASGGKGGGGLVQTDAMASLVASVNQLTNHMTQVEDLFRRAMGARPVPKRREGLSVSEEEDLRYCLSKLTDNMANMSRDLKKTLGEHTVVPLSRLIDDLDEKTDDC
ncbi:uncharacterized protein LOC125760151 [Rhipicephalus sanguineus]|uniref:Uncharacterized protein n=1 Tax=Rhipicephalus sanguineus TaxID=34632 RepID=A0A9D4QDJ6_RHISA|nr:uncharacterized protein LOC125760151 [Rhipicephalus sanguineus]KAH7975809.1 hypothetical protein HPB52_005365 [Rhipicephalus sanguineus]